ncbi:hypothetical protein C4D60_Mb04t39770 [Musa balbisiana]|uniref:Uncharacterized protein n=1 Tax=Musa balbisiana TaxID=52838 RepID=A0A4V4HAD1_MUSBA|nr:hypothetical protein C4D60_Mb04t39770 [Musa balbisiana]
MSPAVEAAKEYAAGFAAGVATVITGHPFDTVKALRRSGKARRDSSASLHFQAVRFKEEPLGRSPEPRRRVLRASAWVKPSD